MRPIHLPAQYRRPAALAIIGTVIVAVVAGLLAWPRTAATTAVSSPTATSPSSSATPEPSWGTGPATADYAAVAELAAIGTSGPVVALDAHFRLASRGATTAEALASRLAVEPKLDLTVAPDPDGRSVELIPSQPLVPGAVYRFILRGPSDEELDSWAFQAKQPLRVVGTLPADQVTDVPLNTGIEITFDQDGVTDAASHVTIVPATKGRFEQHGRVLVFVPEVLKEATLYTVTISGGVTVKATGESLAADVRFRFETAANGSSADDATTFQLQDDVFESPTKSAPVIDVWGFGDSEHRPASVRLDVYRLAGLDAAVKAFQQLRAFPRWSRWSSSGLVDTAGLPKVVAIDAKLHEYANSLSVDLPTPLPAGWYVVQLATGTRPAQAILQVTDVAGFMAVTETRTLVWANDVAKGGPIAGATVATAGAELGRTDARGLVMATTPASLLPEAAASCLDPCSPVITVKTTDGRVAFLPGAGPQYVRDDFVDYYGSAGEVDPGFWGLLNTDRTLYRPTDTVNVWGVVRDRASGKVPATVNLRLDPPEADNGAGQPTIASLTIKPGPSGAFIGSFRLADLPGGYYRVRLSVGDTVVRSTEIQVAPIVKPAYQLDVETGRRIYIAGDQIRVTVRATFFEGTPVPGVPLRLDGAVERSVTTDATGTATHEMIAKADEDNTDSPNFEAVGVSAARAEEGEIASTSRDFVVFPSSRMVDAESEISAGRVRVKGSVHLIDVDRLEREVAAGRSVWDLDPRGKPVTGTNVSAHFIELIPTKTRTGTDYDFIEKKAVPVYEYDTREQDAGTVRVKTDAKGTYSASVPASKAGHAYKVELTISDPGGHKATASSYAAAPSRSAYEVEQGGLAMTSPKSDFDGFSVGDPIDLTMFASGADAAVGGKYLFFTAQRGLRNATIQSSSRFVTTFEPWAVPNVDIAAVQFTGSTYVAGGRFRADFRQADRQLDVGLSVDSARYAPGGMVNVTVTTRDTKGAPVVATVIMRAVDEKLFSIGGAADVDPLSELYASVPSGILSTYTSHRTPRNPFEGGDTGGGGGDERSDFRDSVLFKMIETGADGRGSTSFKLSDDLTSWRVSAAAISADLEAGQGSIKVPVGLPFFVDASIAPEYLVADRPTIQVRPFGAALTADTAVTLTVTSKSLNFTSAPIKTTAFETVGVPLPPLTEGMHDLTISATTGSGVTTMTDRLTRQFVAVASRLVRTRTAYADLGPGLTIDGGAGRTTIVLSDAGAGKHLPLLVDLAAGGGARLDRALAADVAASILTTRFGSAAGIGPVDAFDPLRYRTADGGLALLPYGSSDVELSALVALAAPKSDAAVGVEGYLTNIRFSPTETRERRIFALAGLAGLGAPVLPDIQAAAADPDLTVRERLIVAIGAAALGDAATARTIAASIARMYGERSGEQSRLRVGSSAVDVTEATALMAVLSAAIGDAAAPTYWAYIEANASVDALHVLHAIAYVERTLDRIPVAPASFAYTRDGVRQVVDLDQGQSFELSVTAAQRASMTLERLSGAVGITTTWSEPVAASAFEADPDVTIARSVSPSGAIGTDDLVRVDLTVTFGAKAPRGCYQVTDLAPSGLRPVGSLAGWIDPETGDPAPSAGIVMPYALTGQRVSFCAEPPSRSGAVELRYYARVVTPGTYIWEPAVVESKTGPNRAAHTPQLEVTIR